MDHLLKSNLCFASSSFCLQNRWYYYSYCYCCCYYDVAVFNALKTSFKWFTNNFYLSFFRLFIFLYQFFLFSYFSSLPFSDKKLSLFTKLSTFHLLLFLLSYFFFMVPHFLENNNKERTHLFSFESFLLIFV